MAVESFRVGEALVESEPVSCRAAANRLYYAAFQAALSKLEGSKEDPDVGRRADDRRSGKWTHDAVSKWIERCDRGFIASFQKLQDQRVQSDYMSVPPPKPGTIHRLTKVSRKLVEHFIPGAFNESRAS